MKTAPRRMRREWAGRLELVPPAAPFSPPRGEAKEEVSILCARSSPAIRWPRSTTGTRWRSRSGGRRCTGRRAGSSPSRSCAGSSGWLVRLVVPAPGRVAGPGGARVHLVGNRLARRDPPGDLGGAGPGVLAGAVAGVVRPPGRCSGAQQVAGVAVPAPVGVGDDDLRAGPVVSGPDHPAGARQGPLHPLRRPGPGPAGVRPVRRRRSPTSPTTWRTGSARSCAGSGRPSPVRCCWSSSAATPSPRWCRPPRSRPTPTCGRWKSAAARTGCRGWSGCTAPTS